MRPISAAQGSRRGHGGGPPDARGDLAAGAEIGRRDPLGALQGLQRAAGRGRQGRDAAPAARDKALVTKVLTVGDAYLKSLEEATAAAEIEIRGLNPRLSELIITRNLAWSVRAAIGTSGQMFSAILAQNRPFDETEAKALTRVETEGAFGWASVKAVANTPHTAAEIRSAIARADANYFSGPFKTLRDEMAQKLTTGQTVA